MFNKKELLEMIENGKKLVFIGEGQNESEETIAGIGGFEKYEEVSYLGFYEGEEFYSAAGTEVFDGDQVYEVL